MGETIGTGKILVSRKLWTGEESARLADLIAEGRTVRDIAALMGRSPAGIAGRAYYLGLRVRGVGTAKKPVRTRSTSPFRRLF